MRAWLLVAPLVSVGALAPTLGCESTDDSSEQADGDRSASAKRPSKSNRMGMPLDEIYLERLDEKTYRLDRDTLIQAMILAQSGELPVTAMASGEGYQVDRAPEGSVINMAGLRVADEIIAINGIPMREREVLKRAYAPLRTAGAVLLTVRRNGETMTFTYKVDRARRSPRRPRRPGYTDRVPRLGGDAGVDDAAPAGAALPAGVTKTGPNSFDVRRQAFEDALNAFQKEPGSFRMLPRMKDGKPQGVRLYGIRRGSGMRAMGFRNGDTAVAVNGLSDISPAKALQIYSKLKGATELNVEIERRGRTLMKRFRIVD